MIRNKWTVIFCLAVFGISCAFGDDCNTTLVSQCYSSLVHYEGLMFPLYGEDEFALDETCRAINDSFDCVNNYVATCHEKPECDDKCKEMITDIGVFALNTGVRDLQSELCNIGSPVRETYLENYVCLEDNWHHYATCHNESQLSQEFMATLTDPHEGLDARCCFFSWYRDCFTNITRDTCGVNATFFVSFSLHKLIGHIAEHQCKDNPIICARPPLPQEDGLDKDDMYNDIDNSVDSSANSHYLLSLSCLFITLSCVVLFKYVFVIN
ncbi:uncharacterized protein NPIL_121021 [Nephila pilipes]|uniref:Uncharacterized protein n=1 Tax=Nephila pilipes TaxID=299642 RepID=A0A8X6MZL7_NEPPI|nr:uncharacterized protein NPIL_121021 [Nephila pilipes]